MVFKKGHPTYLKHYSEETNEKMKKAWMHRKFPEKDSELELKLQMASSQNYIKFEKQAQFTGRPDIFIQPTPCIFVDGCYWHGCNCKFNQNQKGQHADYIKTRIQPDTVVSEEFTNQGFIVLWFREHEIQRGI
ncbi:MAG: hypothetical protein KGH64_00415 [Candidatus Micrarchaeota archaeon]|nr:hypothetical protein [Candidatus Micrarchaeota archaeon]MDE1833779.1 hypothetical protein [Candidatus Micrarchaeota archaeon]MDE1858933.1 hypothetical protein [Candidatus Micrarchaeota archaeon]